MDIVHGAGAVLVNKLIDQIQADPVEHDGGNDLVDVEVGLEEARDRTPETAQNGGGDQADEPWQLEHDGAVQSAVSAQRVLTRRTDVEQAGLEGKRHGPHLPAPCRRHRVRHGSRPSGCAQSRRPMRAPG